MKEEAIIIEKQEAQSIWTKSKLGDICEVATGKWDANHSVTNGKYRFYTCAYDYLQCDTKRFSGECLILPGNGANVGEVFYYNGNFDAYQRTYVIQNIKLVPKFLYYHLKLKWKKGTDAKQYGSATNYIRIGNFTDYEVSYPSQREQQQIVSKIEELFSELDKGIEELKTAQQQLKVYRQAVLKWAFEGKLTNEDVKHGELPEGWKIVAPTDIASQEKYSIGIGPFGSNLKTSDYIDDGVPLIFVKNITRNDFSLSRKYISIAKSKELVPHFVASGDILITKMGDPPGDCAIYPINLEPAVLTADCLKFRVDEKFTDRTYIFYLFQSQKIRSQINRLTMGVAQKKISVERFKSLKLILPPLSTQRKIVHEIESRLSVCDKIEETTNDSLKQAEALRQSILKKAFEGQLTNQI